MKQDDPQFKLRIPPALKEKLEKAAQENTRTMGAEIVARLQASFGVRTLDNLKMFAKPASEPAELTERVHSMLSRTAAEEYAAALLSQKIEMQEMIEAALRPYMRDFLESIERDRAQWAAHAHAHTGVEQLDVNLDQAREPIKNDRIR